MYGVVGPQPAVECAVVCVRAGPYRVRRCIDTACQLHTTYQLHGAAVTGKARYGTVPIPYTRWTAPPNRAPNLIGAPC